MKSRKSKSVALVVMSLSGVMSNSIVCNTVFAGSLSSNKNKNIDFTRFNTVLDDDNAVSKFKFLKVCPEEKFGKDLSEQKAKKENSFNISNNNNDVKIKDKNKISKFGTKLGIGLPSSVVASGTIAAIALKVKDSGVKQKEISVTPVEPYEEGNTKKNYGVAKILIGVFIPAIIISRVSTLIFNSKGQESIEINSENIDNAENIIWENLRSESPRRVIFNIGSSDIKNPENSDKFKCLDLVRNGDQFRYSLNVGIDENDDDFLAFSLLTSVNKSNNKGVWIKEDKTTFTFLDLASFADKIDNLLKSSAINSLEDLKKLSERFAKDYFFTSSAAVGAFFAPLGTVLNMSWTRNPNIDSFLNSLEFDKKLITKDYTKRRVSVTKLYKDVLKRVARYNCDPNLEEVVSMLNALNTLCPDENSFTDSHLELLKEFYYYVLINPDQMSNKVDNNKVFKCLKELDKKDSNYETFRNSLEGLLNNLSEDSKVLIDDNSANNN